MAMPRAQIPVHRPMSPAGVKPLCTTAAGESYVLRYLNRLSDLLFVLARHAAGDTAEPASHD